MQGSWRVQVHLLCFLDFGPFSISAPGFVEGPGPDTPGGPSHHKEGGTPWPIYAWGCRQPKVGPICIS